MSLGGETLYNLDAHTLALVSSLGALVLAVAMGGIHLAGTRDRAVLYWAGAGLFFAIGHIVSCFGFIPDAPPVSTFELALINSTIFTGHALLLLGVQRHMGREPWHTAAAVSALVIFLLILLWPQMSQNDLLRIGSLSAFYLLMGARTAWLLSSGHTPELRSYRLAVAVIIVLYVLFFLVRTLLVAFSSEVDQQHMHEAIFIPVLLAALLFYLILAVGLSLLLFRHKELHLQYLVRHDPMTGLHNRYSLGEYAARELARAQRSGSRFSVVSFDLDRFKTINDTCGHAAGDFVLKEVANRVCAVIRDIDIAFRMGGEEFLIMLPDADVETATQVADRLRDALTREPFNFRGREIEVTASFGVAMLEPLIDDWESLLRRADRALYMAKESGRNRVEVDAP